jgi:hypothetical protein
MSLFVILEVNIGKVHRLSQLVIPESFEGRIIYGFGGRFRRKSLVRSTYLHTRGTSIWPKKHDSRGLIFDGTVKRKKSIKRYCEVARHL